MDISWTSKFTKVVLYIKEYASNTGILLKVFLTTVITNSIIFFGFHWALGGLYIFPNAIWRNMNWLLWVYFLFLILLYLFANSYLMVWSINLFYKKEVGFTVGGLKDALLRIIVIFLPYMLIVAFIWLTTSFGSGEYSGVYVTPYLSESATMSFIMRISHFNPFAIVAISFVLIKLSTLRVRLAEGLPAFKALKISWNDANANFLLFLLFKLIFAVIVWFALVTILHVPYLNLLVFSALIMLMVVFELSLYKVVSKDE